MKKLFAFVKLALLLIMTSIIITHTQIIVLSFLFVIFSILAYIMYRTYFFDRLKMLISIGLFIILFQVLFNRSYSLSDRLLFGCLAAIRISCASMFVFIMTKMISPAELLSLLYFLPRKIQFIIGMTFSLIPAIISEEEHIALVQKSRTQSRHMFSKFSGILSIIIPLIHRVLGRAEILGLTIVARGYE